MRMFLAYGWRIVVSLIGLGISIGALIIIVRHITSPLNPYHMKPTGLFITISVVITGLVGLIACSSMDTRKSTDYSVIRDLTDSVLVMPEEDELVSDLGIDLNIWNGINFSFFNVSDVSYTKHWRLSLPKGGERIASSEYSRKREVNAFKSKLTQLLDSARSDTAGRNYSSIYLPIAEELTRLSNSNADRKVLVVYSDLMENTPELSFYNANTFAQLETDPDLVEDKLSDKAKLPDLTRIEIHLIYEPKNADDDSRFRQSSNFFKQWFEKNGATVDVSANLTN